MILTTSYLFSHVDSTTNTLHISPYLPERNRSSTTSEIPISSIAYITSPSESNEQTCSFIGRNSDSSYTTNRFTLDADSPPLPSEFNRFTLPPKPEKPTTRVVNIVLNPQSGHGYSSALLNDVVLPLLKGVEDWVGEAKVWETTKEGDGERIGREIVERQGEGEGRGTVLVMGGDGTVHEVLNGALMRGGNVENENLDLVLIPCGTANALYYHLFPPSSDLYPLSNPLSPFYSLVSFLRQQVSPQPLPLALNTISRPPSSFLPPVSPTLTSVVTSAALHACLLHDAESLRSTHPGVERFKLAAMENVKRWWMGRLSLKGHPRLYSSASKEFVATENVELDGPFAYWISALTDRFEQNFVVAPLRSPLHSLAPSPSDPSIDLILILPLRHLPTKEKWEIGEKEGLEEGFGEKVWRVTGGMYDEGKHVDMRYEPGEGVNDLKEGDEEGKTEIVEVWRCQEFEWTPTPFSELKSNLICLDGALHDLGEGGKLTTKVLGDQTGVKIWS